MNAAADQQLSYRPQTARRLLFASLFMVASVVTHVAGFSAVELWSKRESPKPKQKPMELVMIDVKPPPEVPKEEPPPPPPPPKVKPPPVKVAKVDPPKELPKDSPPPPPNEEPPPETPPKTAPIVVGISMSSTSTTGNFNAPVGNTMYGKTDDRAVKPEEVKTYAAPKYVPSYQVDSQPQAILEVKGAYTADATRAGIEGSVILKITIDANGDVTEAKLLQGIGYGLDEVALSSIRKFKFRPAVKGGESVSTTITYKYSFLLE